MRAPILTGERVRMMLLAFLVLFVELALIRWIGSNVVYLSYFSNFVLLGSFLGIGIGFLRGTARRNLFRFSPIALALLVMFVRLFPVELDRTGSELVYFGDLVATGLPIWLTLPIIFVAVSGTMALLAEGAARQFVRFVPLEAYRLDIAGSIAGILAFTALSFLGAPPLWWGLVAAVCFAIVLPPHFRITQAISVAAILVVLLIESMVPAYSWSPYYRVGVVWAGGDAYAIEVNGIPHQNVTPADEVADRHRLYLAPYDRINDELPGSVLIVGAGTGTDVAVALARGAERVDAVEIDPRLHQLGRELNADRPYSDPRVTAHVTDGRAFLEQSETRYDLILFALPDSLTLVGGQSSVRLESYLFTREALGSAREHLAEGGVFAMYNYYREDWLIDRLAGTLEEVFRHRPCIDSVGTVGRQAALTIGLAAEDVTCARTWTPSGAVPPPSTDDHPFLYLRERGIPGLYLVTVALILFAAVGLIGASGGAVTRMRGYLDLFFMGAAFLLLETKSVVQFALLFGTTWFVNALVFIGVLGSVYLAIEVAQRVTLPSAGLLYAVVVGSVLAAMVVPLHALLELPLGPRFVVAVVLWFTPIFIANLLFAQRFRAVGESSVAFGANLLGAVAGGVLEYAALVTGYQVLAVVVALLYGCAFLVGWRSGMTADMRAASGSAVP